MEKATDAFWKKSKIRSSPKLFTNSDCVLVEYEDCINFVGFTLLRILRDCNKDIFGFDMDDLKILDLGDLLLWYCNRKNRNFLIDLWDTQNSGTPPYSELNSYIDAQYTANSLYTVSMESNIVPMISVMQRNRLMKQLIVYSRHNTDGMREDVHSKFGMDVTIMSGKEFSDILDDVPADITYIFSDATKILTLEEMGRLDFSAIMLASNFGYNRLDDGSSIINFENLLERHTFKYGFVDLCGT